MAGVTLKKIPKTEHDHIMKLQYEEGLKKGRVLSKESVILKIIKEHREMAEKKKD